MRLYSYVIKHDTGFAPNPFWGYCTLAACTPNHMGVNPSKGDWFIGTSTKTRGNKLVYAMKVSEVLSFDKYYLDNRYQEKKPVIKGTWIQRVGDNIYYKDNEDNWKQSQTLYHREDSVRKQDLKNPRVFISNYFFYFGKNAVEIPERFKSLALNRHGCKYKHESVVVENFLKWLEKNFKTGIHGTPFHNKEAS